MLNRWMKLMCRVDCCYRSCCSLSTCVLLQHASVSSVRHADMKSGKRKETGERERKRREEKERQTASLRHCRSLCMVWMCTGSRCATSGRRRTSEVGACFTSPRIRSVCLDFQMQHWIVYHACHLHQATLRRTF